MVDVEPNDRERDADWESREGYELSEDEAMRLAVDEQHARRRDVRELRGRVRLRAGYDHKRLREGVGEGIGDEEGRASSPS